MIFNTIPYGELIEKKLLKYDTIIREKNNELNPDYPALTISQENQWLLVNKLHKQEKIPDDLLQYFPNFEKNKTEIQEYLKKEEERIKATQEGKIIIPELSTEELLDLFVVTKEDITPFIETKEDFFKNLEDGKKN